MQTRTDGNGSARRAEALRAWATEIERLSPAERADRVRDAAAALDGRALGEALTAWAQAILTLTAERPDLAKELAPAVREAVAATDFGKVREAVERLARAGSDAATDALDPLLADPVVMANLFTLLPPLANALLRVLSDALGRIDMPSEVLASSLFNSLSALDHAEIGRALTRAAGLIEGVHEGSILLGRDEPRFRRVLAEFADGVIAASDTGALARAAVALGEDAETALAVLTEIAQHEPALAAKTIAVQVSVAASVLRGAAGLIAAAGEMPDEAVADLADHIHKTMRPEELARAANGLAHLGERIWTARPEVLEKAVAGFAGALDSEQAARALARLADGLARGAAKSPSIRAATTPEAVGRRINDGLIRFNRRMESRPAGERYFKRLLAEIDARELEKAVRHVAGGAVEALFAAADRGRAVVRPLVAAAWRAARLYVAGAWRRLVRRGG